MNVNSHGWMSGFLKSIMHRVMTLGHPTHRRQRRRGGEPVAALESRTLLSAFVVTSAADNTTVDSLTTLREAIILANAGGVGPHTITFGDGSASGGTNFTDGVPDTITLSLGQMAISQSVTITGQSAANTIINGNNASRILDITSGATTLRKLKLTGGKTTANSDKGGAIRSTSTGALTVIQSALSGNSTTGIGSYGGAIFSQTGAVTVSQSTLSGNSTTGSNADGGAIYAVSGAVTVSQSTLSGNSTGNSGYGGAIYARSGAVTVSQSTIAGNHATLSQGGGIFSVSSPITIQNSIIARNTDGGTAPDIRKSPTAALTVSYSLIGDNTGSSLTATVGSTPDVSGNFIGGAGVNAINPQLGLLLNNGGPTLTHALQVTSLALNKGNNTLIPLDTLDLDGDLNTSEQVPFDERGVGYARIDAGTVDMGAVEKDITVPTVTITMADTALLVGETSLVTFTFSEAVTGFTNADLTIDSGTLTAVTSVNGGGTWTATFTPLVNVQDAANMISLNKALITDIAGNAGVGTSRSPNYTIETLRPTVVITMADAALKAGETSLVTFTFSEAVTGFTNADLTIASGTLTAVASANGGITWTATFTPTVNLTDATNVISLNTALVTDIAGNAGTGTTSTLNYTVDTLRPTVTITMADVALLAGETSLVTFTFSEAVIDFTNADLVIASGTLTAVNSVNGGVTWTATFTPTANITDVTNVISLNTALITDIAGNVGVGTTSSPNYTIQTIRPTVSITMADVALKAGDTSLVTFTFSEAVTGFTNADLTIENGTMTAVATANAGVTWTATFTPNVNITDTTNVISLNTALVANAVGNGGAGTTSSPNYTIDTLRPTVVITMADTALKAGETSLVTFTFNEAVTGFTNADLTIVNGTLTAVTSANAGLTWTATFTPTAALTDPTNVITLNNTLVNDLAGNAGAGTTSSPNYAIDNVSPTVTITMTDAALKAGETSLVTFTFSEAVTGFTNADLTIASGTLTAVASVNGGVTWTATFTPTANLSDTTNVITLNNTLVTDIAGNAGTGTTSSPNYVIETIRPTATITMADTTLLAGETSLVTFTFSEAVTGFTNADLTIASGTLTAVASVNGGVTWTATFTPTVNINDATNIISLNKALVTDIAGNAGSGTTSSPNYTLETLRPTVVITMADTALKAGETSLVTFTFNEAVTGFTNADLTIANGTLTAVASANGGVTWTATFTPTVNITDTTNLITLNNALVNDIAGNAGAGTTSSLNYKVDTLLPTVTITMADAALLAGETSLVTFTFSEAVTGFTNADLTIENGTLTGVASANGGVTWTATFTPTVNISDATNVISLNTALVTDLAGNVGSGTTSSPNYTLETIRPTVTITMADAALLAGETSLVTFTFSEAVTGFTNADLTIANGTLSTVTTANGGVTWTATFTPTAAVTDTTNVITLNKALVTDLAGNAGTGTTSSPNYTIDSVRPTVVITMADAALKAGETSLVTFTFSEAVTGFTNADLTIENGTLAAVATANGGVTWTATFTPTVNLSDATNVISLNTALVNDLAGNAGTGTTSSPNYAVETLRPTATITMADTTLLAGESSLVTFTFSEAVTGFTNSDLTIANGTLTAVASVDGGVTWTATFTPTDSLNDATNVITLNTALVNDLAGNAGTSSTSSPNYTIETRRPTVTIVVSDLTLLAGETSLVTFTFNEAVTGFTNADLTIANGTLTSVTSANGGVTWTATFTPTTNINDTTNVISLNLALITDIAGNTGTGITSSNNYAVNTIA